MSSRVLVVFDSFKDALSAERACEVAARALATADGTLEVAAVPLSDGGEGFARILTMAAGGGLSAFQVTGPNLKPVRALAGVVESAMLPVAARDMLLTDAESNPVRKVAILDMASASGLPLLEAGERNPWRTTSRGTGELIHAVAEQGADVAVLGIGGSATSDLGLGALEALGLRCVDRSGRPVDPVVPDEWPRVAGIEGALRPGLPRVVVACDVRNPLLGPEGAASVYGPQKGLEARDFERFDQLAARLARMLCEKCGVDFDRAVAAPGAGAAGGICFGLATALRAKSVAGFDLVSAWLDLKSRISAADIVITGEGRTDVTSFSGKAVGQVASLACELGRRCVIFAGSIEKGSRLGEERVAITPDGVDLTRAIGETEKNLSSAIVRYFTKRV